MPTEPRHIGTFEAVAIGIASFFSPLKEDMENGRARALLAQMGLALPLSADGVPSFQNAISQIILAAGLIPELTEELINAIDAKNEQSILTKGGELALKAVDIVEGISTTASAIRNLGGATGIPVNELNDFADKLPKRLIDYLIVRNLEKAPIIPELLEFIGVIERNVKNLEPSDLDLNEFTEYIFSVDNATAFINSPLEELKTRYDWGKSTFDGSKILSTMQSLLGKAGFPAIVDESVTPHVLDLIIAEIKVTNDQPKGLLLEFKENINIDQAIPFNQGGDWQIEANISSDISQNTVLTIRPDGTIVFDPPNPASDNEYGLKFTALKADNTAFIVFGQPSASRIEVKEFIAAITSNLNFDSDGKAEAALNVGGKINGGKVFVDTSNGDGFINNILSGIKIESDFDLGFGFSSNEGIYFVGSSALEIQLPTHIDLGPIEIDALTFSVGINGNEFPIGISANIKAELGPLSAVVEEIGVIANLSIPPNGTNGNLGPVNFDIGFKPPKGVGLSIDVGVVKGGGYLFFDFDKGEYAGALELTFSEIVSLKAIGLINTKMPDGSDGFSLIIIITAEFGTGIQLGFGFTLLGVGGLLGLNRTMRLDALAEGVRTGSTENIMFPTNVVENAPRIISDLRNFFPVEQGKFLIGPMAKLGWGTPTLISISLGIIIEIPGNIAILGVLKIALPTEEAALIVLQINFIGAIEFDKDRLWFFASMYDSRVLFITLEGEMGLLVGWGSDSNFVCSVGGFHPAFNPPPLPFPNPVRISLNILNESWGRIRVMGYFAVTSNTAQFGARAELYFGISAFNIDGHIGFDALFQFSPFYMIIQLSASLSVKVFGIGLFSVRVRMSLEGPSPWHANGTGSISLLFWDIDVDFDFTWGEEKDTVLPPISVMPLLVAEYEKQENWKALVPANNTLFVSLKEIDNVAELVLHPVGSLQITQRAIPLKLSLDKFGTQKPDDANNFILETDDSELAKINDLKEKFAIAQFVDLKDAEKLSSPSYQLIEGGLELSVAGEQLATGKSVKRHIRYELITIDSNYKRGLKRFFKFITSMFNVFLKGNSVARAKVSYQTQKNLKPFDELVIVQEPGYSVANTRNNTLYETTATFGSQAQAIEFMNHQINTQPELQEELHVIPNHEINTAA